MEQQPISEAVISRDSNYSAFQEAVFIPAMHTFWRLLGEGQTLLALDINAVMLSWCDETKHKERAMNFMYHLERDLIDNKMGELIELCNLTGKALRADGVLNKTVTTPGHLANLEHWKGAFAMMVDDE